MISRSTAPVKGVCKDFGPRHKIMKTNRKTQKNCSFNLQKAGILGKQKAALPGGATPLYNLSVTASP